MNLASSFSSPRIQQVLQVLTLSTVCSGIAFLAETGLLIAAATVHASHVAGLDCGEEQGNITRGYNELSVMGGELLMWNGCSKLCLSAESKGDGKCPVPSS